MKSTQTERLIKHLENGSSITSLQAYNELGITQLATRISEIEARGYKLSRNRISVENRFKETCSVVKYLLVNCDAKSVA